MSAVNITRMGLFEFEKRGKSQTLILKKLFKYKVGQKF